MSLKTDGVLRNTVLVRVMDAALATLRMYRKALSHSPLSKSACGGHCSATVPKQKTPLAGRFLFARQIRISEIVSAKQFLFKVVRVLRDIEDSFTNLAWRRARCHARNVVDLMFLQGPEPKL